MPSKVFRCRGEATNTRPRIGRLVARKQAELKYVGKYVSISYLTNGTSPTEIVQDDRPGA